MAQIAADSDRTASVAAAVANPAPLGLSAFALTTFVLSASNAGFIFSKSGAGASVVIGLAIFYGGLGQLIAGIQEFRAGNTFGGTAFCSYGGFWLAVGIVLLPPTGIAAALVKEGDLGTALGVFALGWAIFTGMMFLGTLRTNLALIGVFGFLFLTFVALTIGYLNTPGSTGTTWLQIGGWLGIVTALLAWYTALAGVLASSKSAFQLPVFPMG
jgi:succinate-acetate transporter protein